MGKDDGSIFRFGLRQFDVLHSFGVDGVDPNSTPLLENQTLYGTTRVGGSSDAGTFWSYAAAARAQ